MRLALLVALAAALLPAATAPAAAGEARRAMDRGFDLFAARSYEEASRGFEEAAAKAGGEGLDPATARYNQGSALLRAGKGAEAAAAFAEALRTVDARLRGRAQYNRGVALATAAEALETRGETAKAIETLGEALDAYESAMRDDPGDEDPKVNHELAFRKRARLQEKMSPRESQQGARPPRQPGEQPPPRSDRDVTADQARMMLEAMKQQETARRSQVRVSRGLSAPVDKDW